MNRFLFLGLALLAACNQTPPPKAAPAKPVIPGPDLAALADSTAPAALLAYGKQYPGSEVLIKTRLGNIRVKLYDDTPIHKANFLLLARKGVFDETMFNRVVKDFAVQGGQTYLARTIRLKRYRLPPEFRAEHFHHKGALGMARYDDEQNPGHLSSNTDFYFVVGEKMAPFQSQAMAGRKLTPAQQKVYATEGGVPSLDGKYTVFGEVIEGLDVVDKISKEPVESDKWPVTDIPMKVEVVK
ncbi:peptidylprolyl isomerase [Hymenobacter properus]|uniref:peptidylprolyl isomerase n=1 Tax=Hymenobacter properus TaxID=2791026 RepID=A0A931FMP7_9BACT|nr:peptidylprolyl isomerase [Hymenobacter properus]MBF9143311.1 peptidylprolyl isomerase [Hymenobacter properus]MBR7722121.1 peptidylprolyl isomerase [Microvirga sp. SRT04]